MYLNFSASVPVDDSVLTEAMAHGKKKTKQMNTKMNYCPKTETVYYEMLFWTSGTEWFNSSQWEGETETSPLTTSSSWTFNIPFIQIQLKAVRRGKIKSKPLLYKKAHCNLSHSLFCLWVFALAYNPKVFLCCTSVQNQVRCELKVCLHLVIFVI